jgi:hypothetical protein
MARSLITDGDGRQIWKVTVNISNKCSRTDDNEWSSSLGLGVGLQTSHHRKSSVL